MSEKLLEVKHLSTSFFTHVGEVKAIRDISFAVDRGEFVGIVGESERVLPLCLFCGCFNIPERLPGAKFC